jgi:hypothetical protein
MLLKPVLIAVAVVLKSNHLRSANIQQALTFEYHKVRKPF